MTNAPLEMGTILIEAIVGSTAYGLAREGSDQDILGVFAKPSVDFWRLHQPEQTYHDTAPDYTYHEIGKYLNLALKCNPTLVELLWLDPDLYTDINSWGERLREIRAAFLSENYVRSAFGGYAKQQAERLMRRNEEGKPGFSSDTQHRTAKHARHCFRLLRQGRELLETGQLTVKVANPSDYWAFDDMDVREIYDRFMREDELFKATTSVLPAKPSLEPVEKLLEDVRWAYL